MLFLYVFPEEITLWTHLPLLEADNETAGLAPNFANLRKNSGEQSEHGHHKSIPQPFHAIYQYSWKV